MEKETKTAEQRGEGMAFDKAKYNNEYKRAHFDQLNVRIPKGSKEELAKVAQKQGKTLFQFVRDAIYYYMDALEIDRINLG